MSRQKLVFPLLTTDINQGARNMARDKTSTLLGALHKLVLGVNMFSICNRHMEQRVAEAFVDDTDCTYVDQKDQANETPSRICD
eukprot:9621230-Ditylum_brightwellii.AAC.1